MNDATEARRAHRLAKADAELVGYYTANIGLSGTGFEGGSSGVAFDSNAKHESLLKKMRWLERVRSDRAWFDAVSATLARLPAQLRARLALVYMPHGWPTWLADALAPVWGGGSFVALASTLPRAITAAEGRKPGSSIVDWFAARGRGSNDALWRHLKDDCMALRLEALEAYEPLRIERVRQEAEDDREAKRRRTEANERRLAVVLGATQRRRAARFERRIGRAA